MRSGRGEQLVRTHGGDREHRAIAAGEGRPEPQRRRRVHIGLVQLGGLADTDARRRAVPLAERDNQALAPVRQLRQTA